MVAKSAALPKVRACFMALIFYAPLSLAPSEAADQQSKCKATLSGLRALETRIGDLLGRIQTERRNAETSSEWYGREEYGPYVDTLRDQERKLRMEIEHVQEVVQRIACPRS